MYNNYNNPYFNPIFRPNEQQFMQTQQNISPIQQNVLNVPKNALQGKVVDNVEVVKATDIPMDGTVSYFPLADNSTIVTKQLNNDGTSKITIFKPITEEKEEVKYITPEELKKALNDIDLSELDDIKDEFKEFKDELKEIRKQIKKKGE